MANETKIFVVRHARHGIEGVPKNMIPPSEEARAMATGRKLAEMGVKIDWVVSSPQPRAYLTCARIIQGTGVEAMPFIYTYDAIGDSKLGNFPYTKEEMDFLVEGSKAAGKGIEEFMLTEPLTADLEKKQRDRGHEGAIFLSQLAAEAPGSTGLIASHGGGRIEIVIDALMGMSHHYNEADRCSFVMKELDVVELTFERKSLSAELIEFKLHGQLA